MDYLLIGFGGVLQMVEHLIYFFKYFAQQLA